MEKLDRGALPQADRLRWLFIEAELRAIHDGMGLMPGVRCIHIGYVWR